MRLPLYNAVNDTAHSRLGLRALSAFFFFASSIRAARGLGEGVRGNGAERRKWLVLFSDLSSVMGVRTKIAMALRTCIFFFGTMSGRVSYRIALGI